MSGYLINEILVAIGYFTLAIIYPFLFNFVDSDILIRQMLYFHLWDSLTVHIFCWKIYLFFAKRNNKKYHREMNYEQWKEHFIKKYSKTSEFKKDMKRKLTHFYPALIIIGFYFLGIVLEPYTIIYGINSQIFSQYWQFAIAIHFLWMMNIGDLFRLNNFKKLGKFGTRWFEDSLRPSELETFTPGSIMILSWIPFFLVNNQILLVIVLISSISDGITSIIGIKFGKISIKGTKKKLEGTIAGIITTYLIVIIINLIFPFQGLQSFEIHIIALFAAIGFGLVDIFSRKITDNFLNPVVTGLIIWIMLEIFQFF
jgi:dolichol kinase